MAAKYLGVTYHRLPPLPSINDILKLYRIRAAKRLSQNFLMDPKLTSKIVSKGRRVRGCHVCEVGPGPGGITRSIFEQRASHVTVIEKDQRFLPSLEHLKDAVGGNLHIELGDVLNFNMENSFPKDLTQSWDDTLPMIHIVGNLPFNVSTPLIIRWMRDISLRRSAWTYGRVSMTLTFQMEVAERIVAPPGDSQRSRLSIMCQSWCHTKHLFTIPGRAFIPKPKVDVAVVSFIPRIQPQIPLEFELVEKLVRCVFSFRQKYCKRGIGQLFPESLRDELVDKMCTVADVDPTVRPTCLTIPEFNRLCHAYSAILEETPSLAKFNTSNPEAFIAGADYDSDGNFIEGIEEPLML